jgi:3-deoxy-manno-octulosonate cytidylyltransferase (CMP-KDO synthetase)
MNILAIIPARMGSSRFPGKPMALLLGKPMIEHVYERVSKSLLLTHTAVATCDKEIFDFINSIGGTAVMTAHTHERASDRCAEALLHLEQSNNIRYDIVVMVQGDEPMVNSEMISESLQPILNDQKIQVVNLMTDINNQSDFKDKNSVKVVCNLKYDALYFSREPIPSLYKASKANIYKQVCIIPFRRDFLLQYTTLAPTPLEICESVDMLRVLEHGIAIRMVYTPHCTQAVDTFEDLRRVERLMLFS